VWIWSFWHGGFGLAILRYAYVIRQATAPVRPATALRSALLTLAIATVLTYIASEWQGNLPPLLSDDDRTLFRGPGQIIPLTILAIDAAALLSLVRFRNKSTEQLWLCSGMVAACFDVWLTFHGMERYSLGWYVSKMASVLTSLVILISLFFDQFELYRRVAAANGHLLTMARQDSLTGLANRRRFDEFLDNEWARCLRNGTSLTLLMADIDFFKHYNDRYGHPAGDACLRDIGKALGELVFRPADLAARYGGEEFAIILGATNVDGALATGARIKDGIASLHIAHADSPYGKITMSIGCATVMPATGGNCRDLIGAADRALYLAKRAGRNQLIVAPPITVSVTHG
jgi:diguanylate cyclase (GGDEF)-like protein